MMMRALIVDDELLPREELALLLKATGEFVVVGEAEDGVEALAAIRRERPDVVFLDVRMPGVSGFDLLSMIEDEVMPQVVFVTAHDEFAIRAFDEDAVDYLLKPVSPERLARTVERLKQRSAPSGRPPFASAPITRVPCAGKRTIKLVNVTDVEIVKSTISGVYVVSGQGEFGTELTLQVLEERAGLLRCHKQYLVNAAAIDEVSLGDGSNATIRTRSGHTVPISRRHLSRVRELLGF
ncbi:two-component system response regulator BtsR [Anaeromyxobacter sp. Fw109-5]|uniref:two-component system response regulator BtsR n=1 Tax=Anaeromyxobacter sp. (strain Fw109-5) TaxID=404589 RepID=UPI0000ED7024|nr:two-component system response regulator BtsR [Anaeromyxobacter sp. Fw109-5]ABS27600.1 two component transcriptional regulator, LytTR family [Anaeromyxobacter sp. Fw109-5]